ncbi:phage tail protein [Pimelobacter simplex]|uniref:Microcystin dependent protein n=1 Tax=Nocardioides simplex TaxID=2045 RepID=A0A0A1DN99_NOCSI|nr:tail fiber protein [Pimelobacter simplex]AIY18092.1 Microcystin dependent protein [Pimelobacter simplex]MCG8153702.1 phage tail protein [Pimelobacter simplex]GEB15659.1 tail Collar domain-containing protein [Pimelobacter simplex]SFN08899.1 Microcystin-dependent protein [Pimelobacter simplex]
MDAFVAEIRIFPFNFAPTGWAMCNGQLLPISQNTALFSLLGTFYGGDGKSNFALPDLQGSAPLQQGYAQSGSQYFIGQQGGAQTVTLIQTEMPQHRHTLHANGADPGDTSVPGPDATFAASSGGALYQPGPPPAGTMALSGVGIAGGSLPHNNMQPSLALNYCIALQGIFPQRP